MNSQVQRKQVPQPRDVVGDTQPFINQDNSSFGQLQSYLTDHYQFYYNIVTNKLYYKTLSVGDATFRCADDLSLNTFLCAIKRAGISCSKDSLRTILFSDFVMSIDPYRDFIDSLPKWDGYDYIFDLARTVKTNDDEHWRICIKKWLVAMIASWDEESIVNHTAIIFAGNQGIGKTRWFRSIIPNPLKEYIYSGYLQPKDKETLVKTSECSLILMDELENLSSKDIDSIKALITSEANFFRRAYAQLSQKFQHRASFAGTINNRQFLHDLTGNRRFLCFDVSSINSEHQIPLDMLYSQAYYLFKTDFRYWFDKNEIKELEAKNESFRLIKVEEELLNSFFEPCEIPDATDFLQTTSILEELRNKSNRVSLSTQTLGRILMAKGYIRVKKNTRYTYALKRIIENN